MQEFLHTLESTFASLLSSLIRGRLLNECYEETWKEMLAVIKKNKVLNVFINKSATATKERVVNFSIFINLGFFCIKQGAILINAFGAEKQVDWLNKQINKLEIRYKAKFD
jgi:hypothetical protein